MMEMIAGAAVAFVGYIEIEKTYQGEKPRTVCQMTGQGKTAFEDYRDRLWSAADCLPD
jgi:hypothetical protein